MKSEIISTHRSIIKSNWLLFHKKAKYLLCFSVFFSFVVGCTPDAFEMMPVLPKPLQDEEQVTAHNVKILLPEGKLDRWAGTSSTTRFSTTPVIRPVVAEESSFGAAKKKEKEIVFDGEPLSVNFKDMPLPAFINGVYGDILNVSFTLPPELKDKTDLVTLRSKAEVTPTELYALATEVIAQYGIQVIFEDKLLHFVLADQRPDEIPLLISGHALPAVPVSHRPIFQLIELGVVRNTMVAQWIRTAFKNQALEIFDDPMRNAILLKGDHSLVKLATEMVGVLDQPHMRGRYSLRADPVFLDASALSGQLQKILAAEGIDVGEKDTAVILLPVSEINALLVFASDSQMLEHIRQWIASLDQPGEMVSDGTQSAGLFLYQVRHTTAESIVEVLNRILGNLSKQVSAKKDQRDASETVIIDTNEGQAGELIVDSVRNTILYQGNSANWNQLLPAIRSMDKTDRMVLLEVIIAEITLDDQEELGINWSANAGDATFGTAPLGVGDGGLTLGGSGFSFILDTAGGIFARFNAFAEKKKLSILSTPRLMVKNGSEASIEVGTEVPFISRAVTSTNVTEENSAGIVSETQYRKTGILLSVKPVIFSGNRIELQLVQEASETTPDDTNATSSPTIFNRRIDTTLTLSDGASVLLGGLITTQHSNSQQGVPWLMDLPLIGGLFRVSGAKGSRKEMVMMIIPYIVDSDEEAKSLTRAFLDRLSYKSDTYVENLKNTKLN